MLEIAIVGDLHLAVTVSSRVDNYFESIIDKIKEIASVAKHVVFLGDVFEKETMPLEYFQRLYNELNYLKVFNNNEFYTIIGNHDIYNENEVTLNRTTLGLCNLTEIIHVIQPTDCLTINNYNFYTSYVRPERCKQDLKERKFLPEDILLLHQYYEEFDGLTYDDLKDLGCKRIFLGHEHKPLMDGMLKTDNFTLYRCGSCGRNKADGFQLNRHLFYYVLDNNELKIATIECMKPGVQVFTHDAYNQVNLKRTTFVKNINEVVDKYSNNISTQSKFSISSILKELNIPDKNYQYVKSLYDRVGERFE